MRQKPHTSARVVVCVLTFCLAECSAQPPSPRDSGPGIRLLTPQFGQPDERSLVPPTAPSGPARSPATSPVSPRSPSAGTGPTVPPVGTSQRAGASSVAGRRPSALTSRRRSTTASRGRIRLARAPNMFGDFFQTPPALSFVLPQVAGVNLGSPEILSPIPGEIQNPMIGGGPRLKISDNFSPIPRHRVFVQTHYFHELFRAEIADSTNPSLGQFSRRESVFVTTIGAEFLTVGEDASLEFRLPMLSAPSTGSQLTDPVFGPTTSQSASREVFGNLSVIYKQILAEDRNYLLSGGVGLSIPFAGDVKGNLADVNYRITNETLNIIPFLALLAAPAENVFFQLHTQLDVPVDDDDFFFEEQPSSLVLAPESGRFGSYRESILASLDAQVGWQMYRQPPGALIRSLSGVLEFRATTALTPSTAPGGTVGGFFGDPDTALVADLQDIDPQPTWLNMTFGLQLQLADSWHLRVGHVVPLINSGGFRSESMLQLERRF